MAQASRPEGRDPGISSMARGGPDIRVEFMRRSGVSVRGPVTGRLYRFEEGAYTQAVDPRDAAHFLATGYFRRS